MLYLKSLRFVAQKIIQITHLFICSLHNLYKGLLDQNIIISSLLNSKAKTMHYIKIFHRSCLVQNFMRINSYVLNIFYRMSFKENIWRKLILSTLFSKFRHIRARFLSARKLSVIKDHLKKRIKLFPVCPHFFLFWDIFYSHFDWPISGSG